MSLLQNIDGLMLHAAKKAQNFNSLAEFKQLASHSYYDH